MQSLHQMFIGIWVILLFVNLVTALSFFGAKQTGRALRHVLIACGAGAILLLLHALGPLPQQPSMPRQDSDPTQTVEHAAGPLDEQELPAAHDKDASVSNSLPSQPLAKPLNGEENALAVESKRSSTHDQDGSEPSPLVVLLDTLWYIPATLSPIISIVAAAMLFIFRRRAIRLGGRPWERPVYVAVMIGGMVIWLWNGLRPTPQIFEDRFGLYWGAKTENLKWKSAYSYGRDPAVAYRGHASLKVQFGAKRGWLIFHHFPMPPTQARYEAIEFAVRKHDLKQDLLLVCLYGERKKQYPGKRGITVTGKHFLPVTAQDGEWRRVRIPLDEFKCQDKHIIGIGIGKDDGKETGCFYVDCIRLIVKGSANVLHP